MTQRNLNMLASIPAFLAFPVPVLASGGGVLGTLWAELLLVISFLVTLFFWPTWRQKLTLSVVFFTALIAANLAVASVPYSANKVVLTICVCAVPAIAWAAAAYSLRRKQGSVAPQQVAPADVSASASLRQKRG